MDRYDLQARQAPGVAAIAPAAFVAMVAVPGLGEAKLVVGSLGLVVVAALQLVAMRMVRSAGLARQSALFAAWGGIPTTAMLRHRDTRLNPRTKMLFHERLRRLGPDFPIPDEEEERRDPDVSDVKFGAAMDEIRLRAKAQGVNPVLRENMNYGAARNAYGLKPFGLVICAASLVTLIALIAGRGGFAPTPLEAVVGLAVLIIAGIWIWACNGDMVRHHAEAYAIALFEAVEPTVALTASQGARRK